MVDFLITPDDITEILQKRYKEKNSGVSIDDITKADIENFIIESEVSKFCDTFNNVFGDRVLDVEIGEDSVDGALSDIGIKIIDSIKDSLEQVDKEKLLKLLFKLISKLVFMDSEN